ncbi:hypothetical protein SESBI_06574 [Sesbania bispinosa]|nr:hypothetical protein SESBI_06574 [Sesbania bispinosa]
MENQNDMNIFGDSLDDVQRTNPPTLNKLDSPGIQATNDERCDFIDGLTKLNMDSVISCMKGVKNRLDGIDHRINALSIRVKHVEEKTNTILQCTRKIENEMSKGTRQDKTSFEEPKIIERETTVQPNIIDTKKSVNYEVEDTKSKIKK